MQAVRTKAFEKTYKKLLKKRVISSKEFEKAIVLFEKDHKIPVLHFKKIICKTDKLRYSFRINLKYRIITSVQNDIVYLICVCDHDDYDRRNKGC